MRSPSVLLVGSAFSLILLGCGGDVDSSSDGVDAESTTPEPAATPGAEPAVVPGMGGSPGVVPPEGPAVVAPGVVPPTNPEQPMPGAEPPAPAPEPSVTATPEP